MVWGLRRHEAEFQCVFRNRMALLPTQAFYLLINNTGLSSMSLTMAQMYRDHQDDDGFLYMTYASQEMFGSALVLDDQFKESRLTLSSCVNRK